MPHKIKTSKNKTIAEDTLIDIINSNDKRRALRIFERNGRTVIQHTANGWESVRLEIDDDNIRHAEQCLVSLITQSRVEDYERESGIRLDDTTRSLVHRRAESWIDDTLNHIIHSAVDDVTADNIIGTIDD